MSSVRGISAAPGFAPERHGANLRELLDYRAPVTAASQRWIEQRRELHRDRAGAARMAPDEARNYRLPGSRGVVGFISLVSEPYCSTCNRMRLTAEGKFHLFLLNDDELDVRAALRSGSGHELEDVARILRRAVEFKPTGHHLLEGRSTRDRSMFQIGG